MRFLPEQVIISIESTMEIMLLQSSGLKEASKLSTKVLNASDKKGLMWH